MFFMIVGFAALAWSVAVDRRIHMSRAIMKNTTAVTDQMRVASPIMVDNSSLLVTLVSNQATCNRHGRGWKEVSFTLSTL